MNFLNDLSEIANRLYTRSKEIYHLTDQEIIEFLEENLSLFVSIQKKISKYNTKDIKTIKVGKKEVYFTFKDNLDEKEKNLLGTFLNMFLERINIDRNIKEFEYKFSSISNLLKSLSIKGEISFKKILKKIVKEMNLTYAGILIKNDDYLKLSSLYAVVPQELKEFSIPLYRDTVTTKTFKESKVYLIQDVEKCPFYLSGIYGINSELSIPILFGDEKIGVLDLGKDIKNGFSNIEILFAEDISYLFGMFLWNMNSLNNLKKEQFMTSLIIENINTGLIITDENGKVIRSNNFIKGWLGEDICGKFIYEYFNVQDMKKPIEGNPVNRKTFFFKEKYFGYSGAPIIDGKKVIGALFLIRDLTEIRELEERMKLQERLAVLGEMAASMAHEIRNPLAAVKAGIEYLKKKEKNPDEMKNYEMIVKEINKVERIVKDMIIYARRPPVRLKNFNLYNCISKIVFNFKNMIGEKDIIFNIQGDQNIYIEGDEDQLGEVFTNLIQNSIDAMDNKGKITIKFEREKDNIKINFIDTGCGIKDDIKDKIFNPFFTTKSKGTGLGLSISHRIITDHKGKIEFYNNESGGTTFIITLPRRHNG